MTSNDADYLLGRSRDEAQKAVDGLSRGDHPSAIYVHRELAVRYHARAMAAMRPPAILN